MPEPNKKSIKWLHLSDFHLKESAAWSQDVVLKTMIDDISSRYGASESVDLIVISGDLAWSGKEGEYTLVEDFILKLREVTGVESDCIFVVPGNHDIDRTRQIDAFTGARATLQDPVEVDQFLSNKERRNTLFQRQIAFRDFANRVCGSPIYTEDSYFHVVNVDKLGVDISVFLIDSSWLAHGGSEDAHKIVVGEKQLIDMIDDKRPNSLCVGIMHHPTNWLAEFERSAIRNWLAENCHILFRGHVHEDSTETYLRAERRMTVFTAGASYETRTSVNCYGYGAVDLLSGIGECRIHKYRNETKTWDLQENTEWKLVEQHNIELTIEAAFALVEQFGPTLPFFLACLISQKANEIPIKVNDRVLLISLQDELGRSSPIGKTVHHIRHLVYWREIWSDDEWEVVLKGEVDSFTSHIKGFLIEDEFKNILTSREEQCQKIIEALQGSPRSTTLSSVAAQQALELAQDGQEDLAQSILKRLLAESAGDDLDIIVASRALMKFYLMTNDAESALVHCGTVLQSEVKTGDDCLLAAAIYQNVNDLPNAKKCLGEAARSGVPYDQLKTLAIRVAGQAGDKSLLEELREHDG